MALLSLGIGVFCLPKWLELKCMWYEYDFCQFSVTYLLFFWKIPVVGRDTGHGDSGMRGWKGAHIFLRRHRNFSSLEMVPWSAQDVSRT